ncbi:MAG TPA: hypothetical protein VHN18_03405 [Micromonosporaceae bacterium]|nr:hypothetical protein [Micromonosporaceae bacterium]
MNVDKRDRRADTLTARRAPRSGGRTAAPSPRSHQVHAGNSRVPPIDGTAALAPRVWDEPRPPGPDGRGERSRPGPRLRVAPPVPVSAPRAPFVALILVLVVGGVLGILLVNTEINENAFRLARLQKQQTALDLQQQQLQKQIAEYEAPGNVAAAARREGLVESGPPAFIRLPDGKVIGVPQPAGGADTGSGQPGAGG